MGITEIILPFKNGKDISELPKDLVKGLKLRKIKKVEDGLRLIFGPGILKRPKRKPAKKKAAAKKTAPKSKKK